MIPDIFISIFILMITIVARFIQKYNKIIWELCTHTFTWGLTLDSPGGGGLTATPRTPSAITFGDVPIFSMYYPLVVYPTFLFSNILVKKQEKNKT